MILFIYLKVVPRGRLDRDALSAFSLPDGLRHDDKYYN